MLSLATETDRTLFFDFLPIELGTIRGMKTRVQLYTVPGQVFYNATRRMVLKGADCVVFVADSQEPMLDANLESLANLRENLEANEIDPDDIPIVLQYNKRDLPNALPVEILNERLNPRALPFFEAVAMKGQGVEETLKGATSMVFRYLAGKYGDGSAAAASAARSAPPARPASPAPTPPKAAPAPAPPTAAAPAPAPARAPLPARAPDPARAPQPVVAAPAARDELLSSFGEPADTGPELSLEGPAEAIEDMEVLSIEEAPSAARPPAPASARPSLPEKAKETLVRNASEAEDMRRRIGRAPVEPELTLDALEEEEEIEEISLEVPAPEVVAPAPPPRSAPAPRPAPAPPAARPAPPASAAPAPRPAPQAPAQRPELSIAAATTIPPTAPAPTPAPRPAAPPPPSPPGEITAPVRISLPATPGTQELTIPVEVRIDNGLAQVDIRIRLVLDLKLG